jgi:hypothetical protein
VPIAALFTESLPYGARASFVGFAPLTAWCISCGPHPSIDRYQ